MPKTFCNYLLELKNNSRKRKFLVEVSVLVRCLRGGLGATSTSSAVPMVWFCATMQEFWVFNLFPFFLWPQVRNTGLHSLAALVGKCCWDLRVVPLVSHQLVSCRCKKALQYFLPKQLSLPLPIAPAPVFTVKSPVRIRNVTFSRHWTRSFVPVRVTPQNYAVSFIGKLLPRTFFCK